MDLHPSCPDCGETRYPGRRVMDWWGDGERKVFEGACAGSGSTRVVPGARKQGIQSTGTRCRPPGPQSLNMGPPELKSLEANSKLVLEVSEGVWALQKSWEAIATFVWGPAGKEWLALPVGMVPTSLLSTRSPQRTCPRLASVVEQTKALGGSGRTQSAAPSLSSRQA